MSVALVIASIFTAVVADAFSWQAARKDDDRSMIIGLVLVVASLTLMFLAGRSA